MSRSVEPKTNLKEALKERIVGISRRTLNALQSIRKANKILAEDDPVVDLQVGAQLWRGVSRHLRTELWKSSILSIHHLEAGKFADVEACYQFYCDVEVQPQVITDIEKDLPRTYPNHKRFACEEGQQALRNVLYAYAAYDAVNEPPKAVDSYKDTKRSNASGRDFLNQSGHASVFSVADQPSFKAGSIPPSTDTDVSEPVAEQHDNSTTSDLNPSDVEPAGSSSAELKDTACAETSSAESKLTTPELRSEKVGYCQGMNFIAGLLLMYLSEAEAFAALVLLMNHRGLRDYYTQNLSKLQLQLWQLGKLISPKLNEHLESSGVVPVLYGASWLMTAFSADFPISFSARVMDQLLAKRAEDTLLRVAVSLIKHCERRLYSMADLEVVLHFLKLEVPSWDEHVLGDILSDAFRHSWSPRQSNLLKHSSDAETVAQAMERVFAANRANDALHQLNASGKLPLPTGETDSEETIVGYASCPSAIYVPVQLGRYAAYSTQQTSPTAITAMSETQLFATSPTPEAPCSFSHSLPTSPTAASSGKVVHRTGSLQAAYRKAPGRQTVLTATNQHLSASAQLTSEDSEFSQYLATSAHLTSRKSRSSYSGDADGSERTWLPGSPGLSHNHNSMQHYVQLRQTPSWSASDESSETIKTFQKAHGHRRSLPSGIQGKPPLSPVLTHPSAMPISAQPARTMSFPLRHSIDNSSVPISSNPSPPNSANTTPRDVLQDIEQAAPAALVVNSAFADPAAQAAAAAAPPLSRTVSASASAATANRAASRSGSGAAYMSLPDTSTEPSTAFCPVGVGLSAPSDNIDSGPEADVAGAILRAMCEVDGANSMSKYDPKVKVAEPMYADSATDRRITLEVNMDTFPCKPMPPRDLDAKDPGTSTAATGHTIVVSMVEEQPLLLHHDSNVQELDSDSETHGRYLQLPAEDSQFALPTSSCLQRLTSFASAPGSSTAINPGCFSSLPPVNAGGSPSATATPASTLDAAFDSLLLESITSVNSLPPANTSRVAEPEPLLNFSQSAPLPIVATQPSDAPAVETSSGLQLPGSEDGDEPTDNGGRRPSEATLSAPAVRARCIDGVPIFDPHAFMEQVRAETSGLLGTNSNASLQPDTPTAGSQSILADSNSFQEASAVVAPVGTGTAAVVAKLDIADTSKLERCAIRQSSSCREKSRFVPVIPPPPAPATCITKDQALAPATASLPQSSTSSTAAQAAPTQDAPQQLQQVHLQQGCSAPPLIDLTSPSMSSTTAGAPASAHPDAIADPVPAFCLDEETAGQQTNVLTGRESSDAASSSFSFAQHPVCTYIRIQATLDADSLSNSPCYSQQPSLTAFGGDHSLHPADGRIATSEPVSANDLPQTVSDCVTRQLEGYCPLTGDTSAKNSQLKDTISSTIQSHTATHDSMDVLQASSTLHTRDLRLNGQMHSGQALDASHPAGHPVSPSLLASPLLGPGLSRSSSHFCQASHAGTDESENFHISHGASMDLDSSWTPAGHTGQSPDHTWTQPAAAPAHVLDTSWLEPWQSSDAAMPQDVQAGEANVASLQRMPSMEPSSICGSLQPSSTAQFHSTLDHALWVASGGGIGRFASAMSSPFGGPAGRSSLDAPLDATAETNGSGGMLQHCGSGAALDTNGSSNGLQRLGSSAVRVGSMSDTASSAMNSRNASMQLEETSDLVRAEYLHQRGTGLVE